MTAYFILVPFCSKIQSTKIKNMLTQLTPQQIQMLQQMSPQQLDMLLRNNQALTHQKQRSIQSAAVRGADGRGGTGVGAVVLPPKVRKTNKIILAYSATGDYADRNKIVLGGGIWPVSSYDSTVLPASGGFMKENTEKYFNAFVSRYDVVISGFSIRNLSESEPLSRYFGFRLTENELVLDRDNHIETVDLDFQKIVSNNNNYNEDVRKHFDNGQNYVIGAKNYFVISKIPSGMEMEVELNLVGVGDGFIAR